MFDGSRYENMQWFKIRIRLSPFLTYPLAILDIICAHIHNSHIQQ